MTNNFLLDYLLKQKEEFLRNYKIAIKTQGVDAVHDMRVAVKRLHTAVRLLNFNEKANFRLKKSFKSIRFVYKKFGRIRDLHVLLSLIDELQNKTGLDLNQLSNDCKNRIKFEIKILHEFIGFFPYFTIKRNLRYIEKYLLKKTSKDLKKKVLMYCGDRADQLKIYADKSNKEHDLHKARKMVKDIGYLMEVSIDVLPDFATNLKAYKEQGSLLGTWHDRKVLLSYLKSQLTNPQLKNIQFNQLFDEIIKEKEDLASKYYSLIGF